MALTLIAAVIYIGVMGQSSGDFRGDGNGETVLAEIEPGSTLSELGPTLVDKGVVSSNEAFQSAAATNSKAADVKPGFYKLQKKMSAESAVNAFLSPENKIDLLKVPTGATLMDSKVVGGDTRYGIYSLISSISCSVGDSCLSSEELQDTGANADPTALGVPAWAMGHVQEAAGDPKRLEGLIEPGEYVVNPEASAEDILTQLVSASAQSFAETGIEERAGAIGLSPYELLTAASLVEREAPAGEFDKVARVILNRLERPMRLEFDSTVNYGLDEQEVATTDEDRARVTPWNTYAKDGLPATPIASPSIEAVTAMENPAPGNWLFFVTIDKDGTTIFNDTFEQHMADTQKALESGVLDSNR
ncbi:MAG: endolytic transglycosylase MltG [Corynebacterium glucuronolyticum]|nr:endolytic transglycosylase MltG [Corynebacterium glucuronolyticum]MDD7585792.1 endolytic transglycosylase MltG [Mycobacteriaceae bacterium]MDY5834961.1 endolytic transglycosylase MltG [Corynebacterium glucuronolyticum]